MQTFIWKNESLDGNVHSIIVVQATTIENAMIEVNKFLSKKLNTPSIFLPFNDAIVLSGTNRVAVIE